MDTSHIRKHINEYLFDDYDQGEPDWDESKISPDWPYILKYEGNWAIPNPNDANDSVLIYLIHEEGKSQKVNPDLYAYHTRGGHVTGADETKGRSVEEYIKSEWKLAEAKRMD